jgi:hypothetical protein
VTLPNRSILVDLSIVLVLAAIAIIGYRYSPLLLPKADLTLTPAAGCDLHRQPCRAELPGGGSIEMGITPHPIPVVKPLQVDVTLSGMTAQKVEIDFAGITMDMGYNRQTLLPSGEYGFTGKTTLPVCITGRMEWVATLLVETDRQRIAIPFHFEAPIGGG